MFNLLERREIQGIYEHDMVKATTGLYFLQRMKLDKKLCVHSGCVNTICWNEKGTLILSGSDDQHIAITDPFSGKNITKFRSGHRSNIFSAKFLPSSSDKEVISCSGSGEIFYTDIEREDTYGTHRFDCHFGSTYKLLVVPNEAATFLSCGDDGTVRFFDLRMKTSCSKFSCEEDVLILLRNAVTSMAVDPVIPYQLAISSSDGVVRLYDRRMLKTQDTHAMNESLVFKFSPPMAALSQGGSNGGRQRCYRVTSLNYRPGSHDLLVNYSSENIYLFNTYDIRQQMSYTASQVVAQQSPASRTIRTETGGVASTSKSEFQAPTTSKEADISVASPPSSDAGSDSESSSFKPIKRLRLRGDWSDTGPDARPEGEEPAQNIMQRMSDLLTRMLNSHGNQEEAGEPDEENENNEVREELQQPPEDQAQASTSSGQQEPSNAGFNRRDGSEAAAAMLHSVMFGSTSSGSRAERDVTRSSISSEGMVSHDLSPPGLELSADPFMETNLQRPVTNDTAGETSESSVQRQECPGNIQTSSQALLISSGGQDSHMSAQSLQSDLVKSITTCESENLAYEESHTKYQGCDSVQLGVAFEASSSSSEETPATVICAKNVSSAPENSEEMDVNEHQKESEHSSRKVVLKGREFATEKRESGSNESSCERSTSMASLQINPSCLTEGTLSASKTDFGLQSVTSHQLAEKSKQKLQSDSFTVEETVLPQVLSDPSSSVLSSESFSVASLWSSSSSAATMAIVEDGLSNNESCNSQQTLCNISSFNSMPTSASSVTEKMSSKDLGLYSEASHGSGTQGQQISLPETDLPVSNKKISYGDSEVLEEAEEADATFNQDYQVEMSFKPHAPCESCGKTRSFGGKGKGTGKSSCKQNYSTKSHAITHPEKFSSYNSGKMRVSSDAPQDSDEAGTSGIASTSSMRLSGSSSSDRRRRHGHSLPPTGNFQLYGSDDEEDDDGIANQQHASSNIGTRQDKERLSRAAQKIQEVFRQRREAREQARIKDVPQPRVFMKFSGHRNCRTVIKEANFYGDNYVMSGSDCGRIMFWERETGQLVMYLNADKHVVNCVQPNPYAPVLASSGIDYDVKIWCPLEQDSQFDEVKSAEIINRNERMLEVTRDTVTVPAAFMLRILASLSQIRNGRDSTRQERQASESGSSNQD
ncbi:hypothetical protein RRG08_037716 [Elysia crispata]|uniref:DDB1- and CUL4-associated factor 6 n=1 Tax=Elysia crispata TaxID=231223 RepID=A0AAE1DTQ4_9GAST|nr:hypothetical protein RRG08_037716 [Elysia crispata]